MRWLLVIAAATLAVAGFSDAPRAEPVHCFDPEHDTVSIIDRDFCEHQIISADQAAAIQEARRSYIKRSMGNSGPSPRKSNVSSFGSGFFVHPSGYAVTNHHVIAHCRQISLLTHDGSSIPAALIASSPQEDLALLKTQEPSRAFARLQKSALAKGDALEVIGFPVRKLPRRSPKSVKGKFIGERPVGSGSAVLMIDAQVWHGSSGSPVIDRHGSVVGVIFAKANIPAIYEKTGHAPDDRAYAMPARILAAFLERNNVRPEYLARGQETGAPGNYLVRVDCFR